MDRQKNIHKGSRLYSKGWIHVEQIVWSCKEIASEDTEVQPSATVNFLQQQNTRIHRLLVWEHTYISFPKY